MEHRIIRPQRGWVPLNLRELWHHRQLLLVMTWRNLTSRYRQTIIGATWAIIQPVFAMLVFSVIFGSLIGDRSFGVPYPLFSYAALVPWMLFANGLLGAAGSVAGHGHMLGKVYFPRLVLPLAPILSSLVDFALAFLVLIVLLFYYQQPVGLRALWLVAFLLLAVVITLGAGLVLSTLNVLYRDVEHAIPYLTQLGLFVTPVAYPASIVEGKWHILIGLNPMSGVVEGFRWALFDTAPFPGRLLWVSVTMAVVLLGVGLVYFRRQEHRFADVV